MTRPGIAGDIHVCGKSSTTPGSPISVPRSEGWILHAGRVSFPCRRDAVQGEFPTPALVVIPKAAWVIFPKALKAMASINGMLDRLRFPEKFLLP